MPGPKHIALLERFWKNVAKADGCWLYGGKRFGNRYAQLLRDDGSTIRAHRYSYEIHHGRVPRGKFVCHRCDVKNCVNPAHLYAGDHEDNNRDRVDRGRIGGSVKARTIPLIPLGSRPQNRALTLEARERVRQQYATGKWTQVELSRAWRVSPATISCIIRGTRNMGAGVNPKKRSGHFRRKLTVEQYDEIRLLYASGDYTQMELADKFDCTQTHISRLIQRGN